MKKKPVLIKSKCHITPNHYHVKLFNQSEAAKSNKKRNQYNYEQFLTELVFAYSVE